MYQAAKGKDEGHNSFQPHFDVQFDASFNQHPFRPVIPYGSNMQIGLTTRYDPVVKQNAAYNEPSIREPMLLPSQLIQQHQSSGQQFPPSRLDAPYGATREWSGDHFIQTNNNLPDGYNASGDLLVPHDHSHQVTQGDHASLHQSEYAHTQYPTNAEPQVGLGSNGYPAISVINSSYSQAAVERGTTFPVMDHGFRHAGSVTRIDSENRTFSQEHADLPKLPEEVAETPPELLRMPSGSSILEEDAVVGEFGRTYHRYKEGKYLLPNDGAEQDRLDFQHAGYNILFGNRLYVAPIPENPGPRRVLDVGTGTGIWAIDFANAHPESTVVGIDLSQIQPANKPSNCSFIVDDAEAEWVYDEKFDYVHLGIVLVCFDDHPRLMRQAFTNMNSGGWIEYRDMSPSELFSEDGPDKLVGTAFQELFDRAITGTKTALNRDIDVVHKYEHWLREAGFVDVDVVKVKMPVGQWPKGNRQRLAGAYVQVNMRDGFLSLHKTMMASGLESQEARKLIENAKAEILDPRNRFYLAAYAVFGRKP